MKSAIYQSRSDLVYQLSLILYIPWNIYSRSSYSILLVMKLEDTSANNLMLKLQQKNWHVTLTGSSDKKCAFSYQNISWCRETFFTLIKIVRVNNIVNDSAVIHNFQIVCLHRWRQYSCQGKFSVKRISMLTLLIVPGNWTCKNSSLKWKACNIKFHKSRTGRVFCSRVFNNDLSFGRYSMLTWIAWLKWMGLSKQTLHQIVIISLRRMLLSCIRNAHFLTMTLVTQSILIGLCVSVSDHQQGGRGFVSWYFQILNVG